MTRPDYDYEAAERRARACGRSCGCDYAKAGDLCDFGESKAERARDERGTIDARLLAASFAIAFGFITLLVPELALWLVLFALGWLVVAALSIPFAIFLGRRIAGRGGSR